LWFCVSLLCDRHRPSSVHPYRVGVPVVGRTVFRLPINQSMSITTVTCVHIASVCVCVCARACAISASQASPPVFLCRRSSGWPSCALIARFAADTISFTSTQSLLVTCLTASNEVSATGCANSGPSLYEYTRVMIRLWVTISEPQPAVCRRRPAPRGGGLRGGGSEGGGLRGPRNAARVVRHICDISERRAVAWPAVGALQNLDEGV